MIEVIVKEFIEQKLQIPVYMEFPSNPPKRFVVIKKGDSSRENLIDSAMFVADSYAETLLETAKLNERVKSAMDDLISLDCVSSSSRAGDYPAFDFNNNCYRYQAVQNITHY